MRQEYDMYQGDTSPIVYARPAVLADTDPLDADWHCYVGAVDADGDLVVPRREVTDKTSDGSQWIAALTPTETEALKVSWAEASRAYIMVVEVTNDNTVPPFRVESHYYLNVCPQGLPSV